jgi:hypothetical protein
LKVDELIKHFKGAGINGRVYRNLNDLNRNEFPGYVWQKTYKSEFVTVRIGWPSDAVKRALLAKKVG